MIQYRVFPISISSLRDIFYTFPKKVGHRPPWTTNKEANKIQTSHSPNIYWPSWSRDSMYKTKKRHLFTSDDHRRNLMTWRRRGCYISLDRPCPSLGPWSNRWPGIHNPFKTVIIGYYRKCLLGSWVPPIYILLEYQTRKWRQIYVGKGT